MDIILHYVLYILITALICLLTEITNIGFIILIFLGVCFVLNASFILLAVISSWFVDKNKVYEKDSKYFRFIIDTAFRLFKRFFKVIFIVSGKEKIPTDKKYLMVYNHISGFDGIFTNLFFTKSKMVQICKLSLINAPVFGKIIHRAHFLGIDRSSAKKGLLTINQAAKYIKEGKHSIGVAPEGTRHKDNKLGEFKPGCFSIAKRAECDIVIVTLNNTNKIFKHFPLLWTRINIDIVDVLKYQDIKDMQTQDISDLVRAKMLSKDYMHE